MNTLSMLAYCMLLQMTHPSVDSESIKLGGLVDKMILLSDGKSHYIAYVPEDVKEYVDSDKKPKKVKHRVFYGDGKVFFLMGVKSYGGEGGKRYSYSFSDPRFRWNNMPRFEWSNGKYTATCRKRKTELSQVEAGQARKLLSAATFKRSPHKWVPYALVRSDRGNYYFVDRGRWEDNRKHFRVFSGPKGNLKELKLKNIVSDSEGDIFSTPTGDLRLILSKSKSWWVSKKKRDELTIVPVEKNVQMIYNELGPYTGIRIGMFCDDL
ncbi:MAG: hypothetical protein JRJ87_10275 [Deltaproteobacteria bacterium]|nr:hypothetical protein [Deltaproteobacteria bacterium]